MSFNLGELENLFSEIKDIIDFVERAKYEDKQYILYLSNGEKLNYKIYKDNIAHLLGVDTEYLKSTKLFQSVNSYDLLKELVENPYRINSLVKEGKLNYNRMFSEFIKDKIRVFKFNVNVNIMDTELVCKYVSERTYTTLEQNEKFDYFILKKDKATNSYAILCLVKNNYNYVPMSSLYFEDEEIMKDKLSQLIKNQEVTVLSGNRINSEYSAPTKPYILDLGLKAIKLSNLKRYKEKFGCIIDTTDDFIYLINDSVQNRTKHFSNSDLIKQIIAAITEGKLLDSENFTGSPFLSLAESINDLVISRNIESIDMVESYSSVVRERKELIEELNSKKIQITELDERVKKLEKENINLSEENQQHRENSEAIMKILKPSE